MSPESFNTNVRGLGLGICTGLDRIASALSALLTGYLVTHMLDWVAFTLFAVCFVVAGVLCLFCKETKEVDVDKHLKLS
jgi:predicted MFS family arabinose efflux permease